MIAKAYRRLAYQNSVRGFSTGLNKAVSTTSDEEVIMSDSLRAKIDPVKGQVQDFLKNVNIYEE
jgi:hypothetical protein